MEHREETATVESPERAYDLTITNPEAIVVCCGDPRFQAAFRGFIHDQLHLSDGKYVPVIIPGGAASLSDPMSFPKEFKVVSDVMDLFLTHFDSIKLVVLINHEDCKKYEAMKKTLGNLFLNRVQSMVERQKLDLGKVAKMLMEHYASKTKVKLYYARFADPGHTKTVFDEVKI